MDNLLLQQYEIKVPSEKKGIVGRIFFYDRKNCTGMILPIVREMMDSRDTVTFSIKHFKEDTPPVEGELVICSIGWRDGLRVLRSVIRRIQINLDDFDYTVRYINESEAADIEEASSYVLNLFFETVIGRQVVFDYVSNFLPKYQGQKDKHSFILENNRLFSLLSNAKKIGIKVADNEEYNRVILKLILLKIWYYKKNHYSNGFKSFYLLATKFDSAPRFTLSSIILGWMTEDYYEAVAFINGLPVNPIAELLYGSFVELLHENSRICEPHIRTFLFEKGLSCDIILVDDVLNMWNRMTLRENMCHNGICGAEVFVNNLLYSSCSKRYWDNRNSILSYIIASKKANDSLKLSLFLWSGENCILDTINDNNYVIHIMLQMSDNMIVRFMSNISSIYGNLAYLLIDSLNRFRVVNIAKRDEHTRENIIKYLPPEHSIGLLANVKTLWENHYNITSECGGYWTWGEGWRQHYEIDYYLAKYYSCNVFVNSMQASAMKQISEENKEIIRKKIKFCVENNMVGALFSLSDSLLGGFCFIWITIEHNNCLQSECSDKLEVLNYENEKASFLIDKDSYTI